MDFGHYGGPLPDGGGDAFDANCSHIVNCKDSRHTRRERQGRSLELPVIDHVGTGFDEALIVERETLP